MESIGKSNLVEEASQLFSQAEKEQDIELKRSLFIRASSRYLDAAETLVDLSDKSRYCLIHLGALSLQRANICKAESADKKANELINLGSMTIQNSTLFQERVMTYDDIRLKVIALKKSKNSKKLPNGSNTPIHADILMLEAKLLEIGLEKPGNDGKRYQEGGPSHMISALGESFMVLNQGLQSKENQITIEKNSKTPSIYSSSPISQNHKQFNKPSIISNSHSNVVTTNSSPISPWLTWMQQGILGKVNLSQLPEINNEETSVYLEQIFRLQRVINSLGDENTNMLEKLQVLQRQNEQLSNTQRNLSEFKREFRESVEKWKQSLSDFATKYPHMQNPGNALHSNEMLSTTTQGDNKHDQVEVNSQLLLRQQTLELTIKKLLEKIDEKDKKLIKYESFYRKQKQKYDERMKS